MIDIYKIRIENIKDEQEGKNFLDDFEERLPTVKYTWKFYPNVPNTNGTKRNILEIMFPASLIKHLLDTVLAWPVMINIKSRFIKVSVNNFAFLLKLFTKCSGQECKTMTSDLKNKLSDIGFRDVLRVEQPSSSNNMQLIFTIDDPNILKNQKSIVAIKNLIYKGSKFLEIPV